MHQTQSAGGTGEGKGRSASFNGSSAPAAGSLAQRRARACWLLARGGHGRWSVIRARLGRWGAAARVRTFASRFHGPWAGLARVLNRTDISAFVHSWVLAVSFKSRTFTPQRGAPGQLPDVRRLAHACAAAAPTEAQGIILSASASAPLGVEPLRLRSAHIWYNKQESGRTAKPDVQLQHCMPSQRHEAAPPPPNTSRGNPWAPPTRWPERSTEHPKSRSDSSWTPARCGDDALVHLRRLRVAVDHHNYKLLYLGLRLLRLQAAERIARRHATYPRSLTSPPGAAENRANCLVEEAYGGTQRVSAPAAAEGAAHDERRAPDSEHPQQSEHPAPPPMGERDGRRTCAQWPPGPSICRARSGAPAAAPPDASPAVTTTTVHGNTPVAAAEARAAVARAAVEVHPGLADLAAAAISGQLTASPKTAAAVAAAVAAVTALYADAPGDQSDALPTGPVWGREQRRPLSMEQWQAASANVHEAAADAIGRVASAAAAALEAILFRAGAPQPQPQEPEPQPQPRPPQPRAPPAPIPGVSAALVSEQAGPVRKQPPVWPPNLWHTRTTAAADAGTDQPSVTSEARPALLSEGGAGAGASVRDAQHAAPSLGPAGQMPSRAPPSLEIPLLSPSTRAASGRDVGPERGRAVDKGCGTSPLAEYSAGRSAPLSRQKAHGHAAGSLPPPSSDGPPPMPPPTLPSSLLPRTQGVCIRAAVSRACRRNSALQALEEDEPLDPQPLYHTQPVVDAFGNLAARDVARRSCATPDLDGCGRVGGASCGRRDERTPLLLLTSALSHWRARTWRAWRLELLHLGALRHHRRAASAAGWKAWAQRLIRSRVQRRVAHRARTTRLLAALVRLGELAQQAAQLHSAAQAQRACALRRGWRLWRRLRPAWRPGEPVRPARSLKEIKRRIREIVLARRGADDVLGRFSLSPPSHTARSTQEAEARRGHERALEQRSAERSAERAAKQRSLLQSMLAR